jgi:hypothetical protein
MRKLTFVLLLACFISLSASAQRVNRNFRNVSLSEALIAIEKASDKYTVNFIYNELEDFTVTADVRGMTIPDAIRAVIGFYPISVTYEGDKIYVECVQKTQTRLKGRLIDTKGESVIFANISLLSPKDSTFITGGVSNESGWFVIPCETPSVIVKISCVGYKTLYRTLPVRNVGTLRMLAETNTLKGVTVKGSRPAYKLGSDGLEMNVQGTVLTEAGKASDVLELMPGVQKNGDSYSVVGKGTPIIYLNGRKVRDNTELNRLSAKDVMSVKLNTHPGAKYDATVKSVIQIRTVKKAGDGWSGSLEGAVAQAHYTSTNYDAHLNWRKGGLDIFGDMYYSFRRNYQSQSGNVSSKTSAGKWLEHEDLMINVRGINIGETLGFNYQIDDKNSFGVKYDWSNNSKGNHSYWPINEDVYRNDTLIESTYYESRIKVPSSYSHSVNAYYNGEIGKMSIDFNNDCYFSNSTQTQDIIETSTSGNRTVNNYNKVKNNMFASKLVLGYPVFSGKLEWGYEYTNTHRKDVYTNEQNIVSNTDNKINESQIAGFTTYNRKFGKLEFNAGVRYEYTNMNYYSFGVKMPEQSRTYSQWFPNTDVTFPIGKANVTLSYTEKTRRPYYSELSSNVQYDSRYVYEKGNPFLKPEIIRDLSLNGVYKWVYIELSYKRTKDYIGGDMYAYKEDSPINVLKQVNFDHINEYSGVLSLSPNIGVWSPRWTASISGQHYRNELYDGGSESFNNPIYNLNWTNMLRLGKGFTAKANLYYRSKGDLENVHLKQSWQIDLGLVKKLDNWELRLDANDIFRTARQSMTTKAYSCTVDKWNYSDSQSIRFTATFNFNATHNKYKGTGAGNEEKNRL